MALPVLFPRRRAAGRRRRRASQPPARPPGRAGGLVLLVLGPTFFAGFRTLEPQSDFDSGRFVTLWLTVLGLMGLMVILALLDVRLTLKLHADKPCAAGAGGDA